MAAFFPPDALKSTAEFMENDVKESIEARNEALYAFKDLGPPDLCQLVKGEKGKVAQSKEIGSYHFVTGVDASSSASIAAYFNRLSYQLDTSSSSSHANASSQSSKVAPFQLRSGVFCCWNAFARVDVRVEVKIPGGVEAYAVDISKQKQPERIPMTDELWNETYVCAVLRALAIDQENPLFSTQFSPLFLQQTHVIYALQFQLIVRSLSPFYDDRDEDRFLKAAKELFAEGYRLGTVDTNANPPNLINNHMARILSAYFQATNQSERAVEFFAELLPLDHEISTLLAQHLIANNAEVEAVSLLCDLSLKYPMRSATLAKMQGQFLWREKGRLDLALQLYKFAVELNPSDPSSWLALATLYTEQGDHDLALQTVNSCPMFAPQNSQQLGPLAMGEGYSVLSNLAELMRLLPQPARKLYPFNDEAELPTELQNEIQSLSPTSPTSGLASMAYDPLVYFAGITGQRDACDVALFRLQSPYIRGTLAHAYTLLAKMVINIGWDRLLKIRGQVFVMEEEYNEEVRKRSHSKVHLNAEIPNDADESSPKPADVEDKPWQSSSQLTVSMFENKRLCERWLDNLFMTLYEDLKQYTIFKAELQQAQAQKKPYQRTSLEWELLGDLSMRLGHLQDAKACYMFHVEARYSFRTWLKLLNIHIEEQAVPQLILKDIEKLMGVLDRWRWGEFIHPLSPIAMAVNALVRTHGQDKVKNLILAQKLPQRYTTMLSKLVKSSPGK